MQPNFRSLLDRLDAVKDTVNITEAWTHWENFLVEEQEAYVKMQAFLDEANGAEVKTKTRSKVADMFQDTDRKQMAAPEKKRTPDATFHPERRKKKAIQLKKAVPEPNLQHIKKNLPKADTDDELGDLDMAMPQLGQEVAPALGYEEQPVDNTALANVSSEVAERIREIEWHDLKDLPGFAKQVIRNMGRQVFAAFGEIDDDDIQVLSTITHDEEDLDLVAGTVRQIGEVVVDNAIVDFKEVMPGYQAHVGVYALASDYYMFVKDEMGEYIYSWSNQASHSKLQHQEPMGKGQERLESVNEDMFGTNEIGDMDYRGFTYAPEVVEEEDKRYLIHHVLDPQGKRIRTPDSFNNSLGRGWEYPSMDEFKHVVNLYIQTVSGGIA
jgi:hypothetical protein